MVDKWYQDENGYIVCANCFRKFKHSRDTELKTFVLLQNMHVGEWEAFEYTEKDREFIVNKIRSCANYIKTKFHKQFVTKIDPKKNHILIGRKT